MAGRLGGALEPDQAVRWVYGLQRPEGGWRGSPFYGCPWGQVRPEEERREEKKEEEEEEAEKQKKRDGKEDKDEPEEARPHDQPHLAMAYCALSLLALLGDDLSRVRGASLARLVRELQQPDGSFSPVPGGVGPVTVAMLLRNVVDAAERRPMLPVSDA